MFWKDNGHLKSTSIDTPDKFYLWKNWGTVNQNHGGGRRAQETMGLWEGGHCRPCRKLQEMQGVGEKWQNYKRECCGLVILDLEWSRRRCRRWLWCLLGGIVAAWSLVPRLVQEAASGEEWGKQAGGESTHWRCILNLRIWHWKFFFASISS